MLTESKFTTWGSYSLPELLVIPTRKKPAKPGSFLALEFTLPETDSSPLKNGGWETTFPLGMPVFTGYVSFREGNNLCRSFHPTRHASYSKRFEVHIWIDPPSGTTQLCRFFAVPFLLAKLYNHPVLFMEKVS